MTYRHAMYVMPRYKFFLKNAVVAVPKVSAPVILKLTIGYDPEQLPFTSLPHYQSS
jgi:hypothetical protein